MAYNDFYTLGRRPKEDEEPYLTAYIVFETNFGAPPSEEELRLVLQDHLLLNKREVKDLMREMEDKEYIKPISFEEWKKLLGVL